MKIRIFALAKELDIDSKVLIDFCSKAGIQVKNVLAGITQDERDTVVAYMRSHGAQQAPAAEKTAEKARVATPAEPTGKVRAIRNMNTMTARPNTGRLRTPEPEPEPAPVEMEEIPPPAEPEDEPQPMEEEAPPVVAAELPTTPAVEALPSEPEAEGELPDFEEPPASPVAPAAPSGPAPLRKSDYVSATGSSRMGRSMQPMTSRGTTDTQGSRQLEKKPKARSGPQIAAIPEFKGPVSKGPKTPEPKAQEPDIRLTPADLKTSNPLTAHLRKAVEKKRDQKPEDVVVEGRKDGRRGTGEKLAGVGLEESRAQRRTRQRPGGAAEEEENKNKRFGVKKKQFRSQQRAAELKTTAEIELPITVRTLSEALGRPAKSILQILFQQGQMVTINTPLLEEEALEIALELGVDLQIRKPKDLEDELEEIFTEPDPPELLQLRPPIVTILGHVDHGKTTLVDKIRSANVAAGEFGGITQHIAAYQVQRPDGHRLTFVDTPGHAAFGEMRARGANVTDVVVLVVAANDGVMPQTVECIAHARAANVPLIVALNKSDLPDRNEQRVLQDLAANNVLAAEWGGDVEVVRTSGLTGAGVPELLDTLLLTAELQEFKANPDRPACGVCLEAFRDEGRGPLAWLIVQKGTLKVGDVVLCGQSYGRIRAMYTDRNQEIAEAPPSTPIKVAGLDMVPKAGDRFIALGDTDLAREIAEGRRERGRAESLASKTSKRTLEDILNRAREGAIQDLFLILKADSPGSLEALRHEIGKFEHPEVRVKVLHEGIGGVNESDVYLAAASDAVIIAFHVIAEDRAEQLAAAEGVDIRRYNIIYEVIDDIKRTLEGMLKPEQKEVITGRAIVLRTFSITRFGTIAGCRVLNGTIERSHRVHLIREQKILNAYGIASLRREKDDVKEVREGMECGIRLEGFNDIKEGDLFEAYRIEEVKRTLD